MPSLQSPICKQRFGAKFFQAKSLKFSAINSITNCMMQGKLKQNNNNSIHNYTQVVKNNTYIIGNKISSYVVSTSTV
jgi:uncharacterized protein with gpF-like domain